MARRRSGRVERAVKRDLRGFGEVGRSALAEVALVLAAAIDEGRDEGRKASELAPLARELRVMLGGLREEAHARSESQAARGLGTPAWDAEDAGSADVGAEGGGGGPPAG